jgi:hypothetical protein
MKIELDMKRIISYGITPNEYVFLLLRILKKPVPEIVNNSVSLKTLQDKGFIKLVEGGFAKRPKLSRLLDSVLETSEVESWIEEWRNLWPSGVKSGGKLVKGSKTDCVKKMKEFLARTNYSKNEVFAATLAYVTERKNHGYKYMSLSNYFIQKKNDSPLEAWCEQIAEDSTREETYGAFHKEI